jgi:hypothetical protein
MMRVAESHGAILCAAGDGDGVFVAQQRDMFVLAASFV